MLDHAYPLQAQHTSGKRPGSGSGVHAVAFDPDTHLPPPEPVTANTSKLLRLLGNMPDISAPAARCAQCRTFNILLRRSLLAEASGRYTHDTGLQAHGASLG